MVYIIFLCAIEQLKKLEGSREETEEQLDLVTGTCVLGVVQNCQH